MITLRIDFVVNVPTAIQFMNDAVGGQDGICIKMKITLKVIYLVINRAVVENKKKISDKESFFDYQMVIKLVRCDQMHH